MEHKLAKAGLETSDFPIPNSKARDPEHEPSYFAAYDFLSPICH